MDSLFRQQVIDKQRFRLEGEVLVAPSISHLLILFFLLMWLCALTWWLTSNDYSRKEIVAGWLEPVEGVVRLHAEGGGVVEKILIKQSEYVEAGQGIAVIGNDRMMREGNILQSALLNEYNKKKKIIQDEIHRTKDIYKVKLSRINDQQESINYQEGLIYEELRIIDKRAKLIENQLVRYEKLSVKRFVAIAEKEKIIAQQMEMESKRNSLIRRRLTLKSEKQSLITENLLMPKELANSLGRLQMRINDIEQETKRLLGRNGFIVRAARGGIITNILVKTSQFVEAGAALFTLEPQNNMLRARLLVPVSAAGFLSSGQEISIRYDAFPYQKFGVYKGEIKMVSDSVLLPSELKNSLVDVNKPVYLVEADIETAFVNAYGKRIPLKSGMTFSAIIKLENRTLMEWLLEPVYSLKGNL